MFRLINRWSKAFARSLSRWLVGRSGLFDAEYYLETYPDVAVAGIAPLAHYCDHGWREARAPGPMVNPAYMSMGPMSRHFSRFNPISVWMLIGRWMGWSTVWPQLRNWSPLRPVQGDIAIVLHAATRTGAPIFALRVARWMRRNGYARPIFILLADGSLLPEIWKEFPCLPLFTLKEKARRDVVRAALPDLRLLYLNSLASLRAWPWFDWYDRGLLLHVHESPASIDRYAEALTAIAPAHPRTIAVSEACRAPLARILGREPDIVPPAIDLPRSRPALAKTRRKKVVGCGTMSQRKGADLFCEVAAEVFARFDEDVEFIWIGGPGDVDMARALKRFDISDRVELVGEVDDPISYLCRAHLLMLPSRDDPFPLVALEAASCGVPVICFDVLKDGVGTWISRGAGEIVPAFDVGAMADAIIRLCRNEARHISAVEAARRAANCFDINKIGPEISRIIERVDKDA